MTTKENLNIYLDEQLRLRLDLIVKRLSHSVNHIDIVNWLSNFRKDEFERAVRILECLEYVTENELIDYFNDRITSLISLYGNSRNIIIHAIGDYGKSGTMITYYLKKAPNFKQIESLTTFYEKASEFKYKKKTNSIPKDSILILLDDFLGSGRSLWNYYKTYIKPQTDKIPEIRDLCSMSIYHLGKADRFLTGIIPNIKIISTIKYQCFKNRKSPFGSNQNIQYYRDFAFYYGQHLFSIDNNGETKIHPLGYNNSQALLVFPYNPPNNTLPIIWSSKFVKKFEKRWIPLYPRNQVFKISRAKSLRNELAYELGLLKMSGPEIIETFYSGKGKLDWKSYSYIKSTDFRLFAYMRLKQQGRLDQVICEILGLTLTDIRGILKSGIKKGIFEESGELSSRGKILYGDCLKTLKRLKKEVGRSAINYELKKINYLPKKFNGKERQEN